MDDRALSDVLLSVLREHRVIGVSGTWCTCMDPGADSMTGRDEYLPHLASVLADGIGQHEASRRSQPTGIPEVDAVDLPRSWRDLTRKQLWHLVKEHRRLSRRTVDQVREQGHYIERLKARIVHLESGDGVTP